MAILMANIGTSDLLVKIDDYYFPVGFDRNEPNLDYSGLNDDEKAAWEQDMRQSFIASVLCPELGVTVSEKKQFSFRELTRRLLEEYQKDEDAWHHRIRPGRIWGVLKSAQEPKFQVREAFIFATDQPETEKRGYPSDTVHLFEIIKKWFGHEIPKLTLKPLVIRKSLSPNEQDDLLNYYYQFFSNEISRDETILISIKGGTPQMQTALKMQAIASGLPKQLFIEPKLSIKRVLAGEPSECRLTSYWRYMRSQKYQAVKLLLESRWDFDGARQILEDWSKVLKFLIKEQVTDKEIVSQSNQTLEQVSQALELGVDYLNLDYESVQQVLQKNPQLGEALDLDNLTMRQGDEQLLNLYTQCYIYWHIDQIANFLARMSSFYEEVLDRLVILLDGKRYFQRDWELNTALVRQEMGEDLWKSFVDAERQYNKRRDYTDPIWPLKGRFTKRNFIEKVLQPHQKTPAAQWQVVIESLKSLDFWMTQRNHLIHSAEGVSQKRMQELLDESRQNRTKEASIACEPGRIRGVMGKICSSDLGIVREEYRQKFIGNKNNLYLYSDITKWALAQLKAESSK